MVSFKYHFKLLILFFQDALQFYDTPRNLLIENAPVQQQLVGPYANYDMPQQPLPVYRKPCGCIMKLIKLESKYSTIMCLHTAFSAIA